MQWSRMVRLACEGVCVMGLVLVGGCPTTVSDQFESISEHGFDAADNARDLNEYPWGMAHFTPDGADAGLLYVATGNNVAQQAIYSVSGTLSVQPYYRPPEIRRWRPDLGEKVWERVFDYRDIEPDGDWRTGGFRGMGVYQAQSDGVNYIYAGTIGLEPTLWRSPTGAPDSWQPVWQNPVEGSIRTFAVHDNLLYFAVSHDLASVAEPGEIFATDGADVWLVEGDGFGRASNTGVYALASFNGWLYAGTANSTEGFEVWKLEGPAGQTEPVQVVFAGGPSIENHTATEMVEFGGHLYVGSLIYAGINTHGFPLRGADMLRLDANDNLEVIVGPGSIGGIPSGFGKITNSYLWTLEVHNGRLYCGTWDAASIVPVGMTYLWDIIKAMLSNRLTSSRKGLYDVWTGNGAELWVSDDGVAWSPVFTDGLGDPDNYGIRNMESTGGDAVPGNGQSGRRPGGVSDETRGINRRNAATIQGRVAGLVEFARARDCAVRSARMSDRSWLAVREPGQRHALRRARSG